MKNLQIPEVQSLGQVLTLDEMKSIVGGARVTITCTCSFSMKNTDNQQNVGITLTSGEPTGSFFTDAECSEGCATSCKNTTNCIGSVGIYSRGS